MSLNLKNKNTYRAFDFTETLITNKSLLVLFKRFVDDQGFSDVENL